MHHTLLLKEEEIANEATAWLCEKVDSSNTYIYYMLLTYFNCTDCAMHKHPQHQILTFSCTYVHGVSRTLTN